MKRFLFLVAMSVGGWAGWWLGSFAGITTALLLSTAFSTLAVWGAWWAMREWMD